MYLCVYMFQLVEYVFCMLFFSDFKRLLEGEGSLRCSAAIIPAVQEIIELCSGGSVWYSLRDTVVSSAVRTLNDQLHICCSAFWSFIYSFFLQKIPPYRSCLTFFEITACHEQLRLR